MYYIAFWGDIYLSFHCDDNLVMTCVKHFFHIKGGILKGGNDVKSCEDTLYIHTAKSVWNTSTFISVCMYILKHFHERISRLIKVDIF